MIIKLIKTIMGKIDARRFVPTQEEASKGARPMSQIEVLEALSLYKAQNPSKYEAKKEALFARYGLKAGDVAEPQPDSNDLELEALKSKVAKKSA